MITASEYLKDRKRFCKEEVDKLKRHAEDFLFFKYDMMKIWNRRMAEKLHRLYCEVLYGDED
ncbi:Uncharacterised protein [Candidatus Tiddalikarchaeum anstoanum]|nr:Uncharacterised protein [Candidatus Tiddalikarchaeum anstoanum]